MIYRRKGSPYYWCWFYHDGKKVQLSTKSKDRRIARQVAVRLEYTYKPRSHPKTPLAEITERYLKHSLNTNSRTTYERERSILGRFCQWVGDKPLSEITPLRIDGYKDHRLLSVTKRTVNREYDALRSMFNKAVLWGLIESNPCHGVSKYRIDRNRKAPNYLSNQQVDLLLYKAVNDLKDMILFALYTGLRKMELVYLQWRDINFDTWTVTVQAKDDINWEPKSGKLRVVPIPKPCRKVLLERKAKSLSEFVFANQFGRPRLNNLNRDLRDLLKRIGLYWKGMGWHTLRHTYASHLAMRGVPLNSIAELLGHQDPVTTKIYAHLSKSHLQDMTERLDYGQVQNSENVPENCTQKLPRRVENLYQ